MDGDKISVPKSPEKTEASSEENVEVENIHAAAAVPDLEIGKDGPEVTLISSQDFLKCVFGPPELSYDNNVEPIDVSSLWINRYNNFAWGNIRSYDSRPPSPSSLHFYTTESETKFNDPNLRKDHDPSSNLSNSPMPNLETYLQDNEIIKEDTANLMEGSVSQVNPNEACGGRPSCYTISNIEDAKKLMDLGLIASLDDLVKYKIPDSLLEIIRFNLSKREPSPESEPQLRSQNEENIEANRDVNKNSRTEDGNADLRILENPEGDGNADLHPENAENPDGDENAENPDESGEGSRRMKPLSVDIPDDNDVAGAAVFLHECANPPPLSFTNRPLLAPAANQPESGHDIDDYITSQIAKYEEFADEMDKFVEYMNSMSVEK